VSWRGTSSSTADTTRAIRGQADAGKVDLSPPWLILVDCRSDVTDVMARSVLVCAHSGLRNGRDDPSRCEHKQTHARLALAMPREARYLHICEALQHQIGTLPPNTLLASEHDLARRFRVSRVTSGARSGSWSGVGSSRASRWHHR
jgi:hypothetical protein